MNQQPVTDNTRHIGKYMIFAAWILVLGMLTFFFQKWWEKENNPNQEYSSQVTSKGIREIKLLRNRAGHYVATGRINNNKVVFLLDTGATTISIPEKTARKLKLEPGLPYPVHTANGEITVYATRLKKLELGDILLQDVRAHINPHMQGNEILLGMTVLKKLEMIQKGDTLTLRQYPG